MVLIIEHVTEMRHLHDPVRDQCIFEMFITLGNTWMLELFLSYTKPFKSNDESYRLVAERVL